MELSIDPNAGIAPYEQIRRRLHDLITAGALPEGHRLPPVRQLAGDLGLALGTVARAYKELEEEGLLVTRRGAGTRVAHVRRSRSRLLAQLAASFVESTRELGFTDEEIRDATEAAL